MTNLFLTAKEFREALGNPFCEVKLYELLRSGEIRSARVGRKYLVPRSELTEFPRRLVGKP
jgi:excisionase family DNA binding protein